MLCVVSLSFIVLPELVKHIPVAGVVRRNIKFDVKILKFPILDTFHALLRRMTLWCRSALKAVRDCRGEVLLLRFLCWSNGSIRLTVYN